MKTPTLEEAADEFLNVVTIGERVEGRDKIFPGLQLLFAMRAAYWIRKEVSSRAALETEPFNERLVGCAINLPYEVIYESYRRLLLAYRSSDPVALVSALREMRIREFCPDLDGQFARMERLGQQSESHVRQIFHVELALFAFELGAESSVKKHIKEAWNLNPMGWERYILCTLQGFYEACSGNINEATHWLEDSVSACFEDESTLIECENRPPNLQLVQKLLFFGERIPAINYLLACKDIWRLKCMPFGEWVHQIELDQVPDFEASEIIRASNRTFHRLDLQSRRIYNPSAARSLGASPNTQKTRKEVLLARKRRLDEAKRALDMIERDRTS